MGLRRPLLHERLVTRAEECGVEFLWKTPVSGIYADGVQLGREKIRARWIIGADGQGSRARRWSGLEAEKISKKLFAIRHHYRVKPWSNYMEVYWGADTQAYVTPGSEQEICIVVMSERAEYATFERAFSQFGELRDRLRGSELSSRQRGAVTAMRSLQNVQRGNVALVGDASGGVDAITGEGLRLAFRQAFALAAAMAAGDLTRYEAAHERLARRPLAMCGLMLWLGRHPRIRARVLRALENKPELFTRLLAMHVGEGSPADVVSAGALLGWQLLAV